MDLTDPGNGKGVSIGAIRGYIGRYLPFHHRGWMEEIAQPSSTWEDEIF